MEPLTIIFIAIGLVAVWAVLTYNGFILLRNKLEEAWSDIDVQLKRRFDLIPNLIETVKGYASHEKETFEAVVKARAEATAINIDAAGVTPEIMMALQGAEAGLTGALSKLMAVAEQYPDLKANENFVELQRELTDTENKIQASRRFYNGTVQNFNTKVESVPSNIIAGIFKFNMREFFNLEDAPEERENIKVDFNG
jgi:LemA protein